MPDFRPVHTVGAGITPEWPCGPQMKGRWQDVPPTVIAALQSQSARDEDRGAAPLPSPILRMRALALIFYPGWFLVEGLAPYSTDRMGVFAMLLGPNEYVLLNGTSPAIHMTSHRVLDLGGQTRRVDQYLRFFSGAVRGEAGPFWIVEDPVEVERDFSVSDKARPAVLETVAPIRRPRRKGVGYWRVATVLYGGSLFTATFRIDRTGMVEMVDDTPVSQDTIADPTTYDGCWRVPKTPAGAKSRANQGSTRH